VAGQRVARVLLQGLRLTPFAERPMHLCTTWLARLPRQHVPPGFKPMAWNDILRPWARRRICASLNATADRDFECLHKGGSALRRPSSICIGSYNALSIVYELDQATGLYDFQRPGRTHWTLEHLRSVFGPTTISSLCRSSRPAYAGAYRRPSNRPDERPMRRVPALLDTSSPAATSGYHRSRLRHDPFLTIGSRTTGASDDKKRARWASSATRATLVHYTPACQGTAGGNKDDHRSSA
jgi:hypothetical protein